MRRARGEAKLSLELHREPGTRDVRGRLVPLLVRTLFRRVRSVRTDEFRHPNQACR